MTARRNSSNKDMLPGQLENKSEEEIKAVVEQKVKKSAAPHKKKLQELNAQRGTHTSLLKKQNVPIQK